MPSDPKANTRVRTALLLLSAFVMVASVAVYLVADLGQLQDRIAAREGQAALQGITDASQIDEALRQHPQNRFLRMMAMATKAADDANAAIAKLSDEVEPPAIAKAGNLFAASRSDLEALRRDLKTAEADATTLMPRAAAVLKAERNDVEKYAASLHLGKDASNRLLDGIDRRHAEITALTSSRMSARADFYRAYQNYVAILVGEFGAYKVEGGQFIFPLQRTVDRYNVAAQAMTAAAKRVAELDEERKNLLQAQQQRWLKLVRGE
ncbi:MAG: hypothetical protein ACLQDM_24950 [Bradyrhizobium sp.]